MITDFEKFKLYEIYKLANQCNRKLLGPNQVDYVFEVLDKFIEKNPEASYEELKSKILEKFDSVAVKSFLYVN